MHDSERFRKMIKVELKAIIGVKQNETTDE